jgi:energy-coupling factor transport system substrate-specific component
MSSIGTTARATRPTRAVRLRPRSALALAAATMVGVLGFGWPLLDARLAGSSASTAHASDAPWLFIGLLALLLAVVLAEVSEGGIDAKAVAVLGVLAGCGAALRPLSGGATGFSFVFFLLIPSGRVLGRSFGFVLGAVTLLASALLTGQVGPWLPFEMLGAAWTGFGAGCLPAGVRGRAEVALLAAYGAASGLLYGLLLNLSFWPFARYLPPQISFVPGGTIATNVAHWVRFDLTTSLGFDIPRAVGNAVLVVFLGGPVLTALRRVARRANFAASPDFGAEATMQDTAPS